MKRSRGIKIESLPLLFLCGAGLLSGCAGGAGRLQVESTPEALHAYAIPARVWHRSDSLPQDIIDQPDQYAKYRFGRLTPTEPRSLFKGPYFVVVTDGEQATYVQKKVSPSRKALVATLDLAR